jgi:M6 family metalloprotease-like protein
MSGQRSVGASGGWLCVFALAAVMLPSSGAAASSAQTGELRVTVIDDFAARTASFQYHLKTRDGDVRVSFSGDGPHHLSGRMVKVHGPSSVDGSIVANDVTLTGEDVASPSASTYDTTTAGRQRTTAVILLNFADRPVQTVSVERARGLVFGPRQSVNTYLFETSFGGQALQGALDPAAGDVFGWYTVPYTSTSTCSPSTWSAAARQMAAADGFAEAAYDKVITIMPKASCQFRGTAELPGKNSYITMDVATAADGFAEAAYDKVITIMPKASCQFRGTAELPGKNSYITMDVATAADEQQLLGTTIHEVGHTLGANHAGGMKCTRDGLAVPISANCTKDSYADPFDVMGFAFDARHFNNFHKAQLGLTADWNVITAPNGGTFTLAPIEKATAGLTTVRVPRTYDAAGTPTEYFYIESRTSYGFDSFSALDPVVNGASIRVAPHYDKQWVPHLVDATPSTSTFADAALAAGRSIDDPDGGLRISTVSVDAEGNLTVTVELMAPRAATNLRLTAKAKATSVPLTWTAPTTGQRVAKYDIYRDGTRVATSATTGYTDNTARPSTTYRYHVVAIGHTGLASPASTTLSVTTPRR